MAAAAARAKNFLIVLWFFMVFPPYFYFGRQMTRIVPESGEEKENSLCPHMGQKPLLLRYHPN